MNERITRESVSFAEPFFVEGLGREWPAGTYEIETVEEPLETVSMLAYRVVSTSIRLPLPGKGPHSYQIARIDPSLVRASKRRAEESERL
jgi:hypothetical protein